MPVLTVALGLLAAVSLAVADSLARDSREVAGISTSTARPEAALLTTTTVPGPSEAERTYSTVPPRSPLQAAWRLGMRVAAEARGEVHVYDEPEPGSKVRESFPELNNFGTPTVFLVEAERQAEDGSTWYELQLPRSPNGSRGWVNEGELNLFPVEQAILVDISERSLNVYERGKRVATFSVGVGREATPTPRGSFFISIKLAPTNPRGAYGPLALGLSAYSEVLTWWAGGGQAAIHGTNKPEGIGQSVSNGCLRMRNQEVLALGELVGVGTPVVIAN